MTRHIVTLVQHDPRAAVLDRLGRAYEVHAEAEQMARAHGDTLAEEQEHLAVLWVLRAYTAEEGLR